MIVSVYESFQIAGRAEGLSRELAMANPFSPQSMLSWFFPFSSVKDADLFKTDLSMSNGYFGLIMLAGLLISFFRKKTFLEKIVLGGSLFFLFASMGSYLPLRGWMYDYIPFMNLFRMPGLFRLFAIVGFIIVASFTLAELYQRKPNREALVKALLVIGVLLITGIIVVLTRHVEWNLFKFNNYIGSLQNLKFNESIILQGLIQLISIAVFLLLLKKKNSVPWLVIDGILACWLCAPVTIVSSIKTAELQDKINQLPAGFRIPELTPMIKNQDREGVIGPLWCNLGIWKKQPIWDGYNNFQTKDFLKFEASSIASQALKNPIIYQSLTASLYKYNAADSVLVFNDSTHLLLDEGKDGIIEADAEARNKLSAPVLTLFTPTKIEATVENTTDCYFTLIQHFTPGWKVLIDNKENPTVRSNGLFISTKVKAGNHKITFIYSDKKTLIAFYISAISLLITLIILTVRKNITPGPSPYF